jgi:hypothetical protein
MTALLSACFLLSTYFISDLGKLISHKDCLFGCGGNTNTGASFGGRSFSLGWLHYLIRKMDELGCIWTVGGYLQGHSFLLVSSHTVAR